MPYRTLEDLPEGVKDNLPKHAKEIYKEAYNNAWEEHKDEEDRRDDATREEVAHRVAWAAVKHSYEKDEQSGKWHRIEN
jgi:cation transport regulator